MTIIFVSVQTLFLRKIQNRILSWKGWQDLLVRPFWFNWMLDLENLWSFVEICQKHWCEEKRACHQRFAHKAGKIKSRLKGPSRHRERQCTNFEINWFSLADKSIQLLWSSRFPRKVHCFSHFIFTSLCNLDLQRHSTLQPCGNQHFLDSWQFAWLSEPLTLMKKKKLIGRENCCQSFKL